MLTNEQVGKNREEYLSLVNSINRQFDKERMIRWLDRGSDFFIAPASTKYHGAYEGGLCEHSLNVYHTLVKLIEITKMLKPELPDFDEDTIKVVALFHDLSKANFYEKYWRNVKDPATGKWEQVQEYRVRDNRFVFGNHEQTAEYIARSLIPLSQEESVAILHHMGGISFDCTKTDLSEVFAAYPLAALLHSADLISCYVLEEDHAENN